MPLAHQPELVFFIAFAEAEECPPSIPQSGSLTRPSPHSASRGRTHVPFRSDQPIASPESGIIINAPLPCVGCGWCCLDHPCDQSIHRHGYTDRCPELFWSADAARYLCAMAMDAAAGAYIREVQRMGEGCCAPQNRWRTDVKQRD